MAKKNAKMKLTLTSTEAILLKRSLNKNGKGQLFFSSELLRLCEPYVPYLEGALKDSGHVETPTTISWSTVYARRQYYKNRGYGKEGEHNGGRRGSYWAYRCWQDHKGDIIKSVADFCGGVAK